jgi:hypothetical protein
MHKPGRKKKIIRGWAEMPYSLNVKIHFLSKGNHSFNRTNIWVRRYITLHSSVRDQLEMC